MLSFNKHKIVFALTIVPLISSEKNYKDLSISEHLNYNKLEYL